MLKGIDPRVSAELISVLAAMGHGDELIICDRNYPAISNSQRHVSYVSSSVEEVLSLILKLFPLDTFVQAPLIRMEVVGNPDQVTEGQQKVHSLAMELEGRKFEMGSLPRQDFYERAAKAYATVSTSDDQPYCCFVLVKGVI
jgi:L-fucose mutarotase